MSKKIIPITIAAAATGFLAGILLAPKSGKETREDIKVKAAEAKAAAQEAAGKVADAATASAGRIKQGAAGVGKEAQQFGKSAKRSAATIADEVGDLAEDAKLHGKRAVETVKQTGVRVAKDVKKNLK